MVLTIINSANTFVNRTTYIYSVSGIFHSTTILMASIIFHYNNCRFNGDNNFLNDNNYFLYCQ